MLTMPLHLLQSIYFSFYLEVFYGFSTFDNILPLDLHESHLLQGSAEVEFPHQPQSQDDM